MVLSDDYLADHDCCDMSDFEIAAGPPQSDLDERTPLISRTVPDFNLLEEVDRRRQRRSRWLKSAGYMFNFVVLGFVVAELGPGLPDLGARNHSTISELAWIFTSRSVGYLIGSGVAGFMMDRLDGAPLLFTVLFCGAIFTCLVPLAHSLYILIVIITVQGFFFGSVDTIGNCLMIETHGEECNPWMQALHFNFALGATIAPLIIEPFLSNANPETGKIIDPNNLFPFAFYVAAALVFFPLSYQAFLWFRNTCSIVKQFPVTLDTAGSYRNLKRSTSAGSLALLRKKSTSLRSRRHSTGSVSVPRLPVIRGSPAIQTGGDLQARLATLSSRRDDFGVTFSDYESIMKEASRQAKADSKFRAFMIFATSFFLFLYVGSEHGYASYVYTYAVKGGLHLNANQAALLTSGFWGSFALGRLIAVPISLFLSPVQMNFLNLVGCQLSLFLLLCYPNSLPSFWVGTCAYGICMASVYPTAINMCETYLDVTGAAATSFVFGSSVGQMSVPLIIGLLFGTSVGPMGLIYVLLGFCISANLVFWIMWRTGTTSPSSKLNKKSADTQHSTEAAAA